MHLSKKHYTYTSAKGIFTESSLRVEMVASRFNKWYLYRNLSDDWETHGDIAVMFNLGDGSFTYLYSVLHGEGSRVLLFQIMHKTARLSGGRKPKADGHPPAGAG
jgi:hypothetical protein